MMKIFFPLVLLGGLLFLGPTASAVACPNCADAVGESGASSGPSDSIDDADPLREARAYNHSIYLMVGMPYLLLTVFGLVICLAVVKHNRAARKPPA